MIAIPKREGYQVPFTNRRSTSSVPESLRDAISSFKQVCLGGGESISMDGLGWKLWKAFPVLNWRKNVPAFLNPFEELTKTRLTFFYFIFS